MSDLVTPDPGIIVPAQSGSTLKAVNAGMTDDLPIPLAEIMDPARTPVRFMPWLASHVGVDLWYSDWSDDRKRDMVAHSAGVSVYRPGEALASLKGTAAAASAYLAYVDTRIINKVSYPQKFAVGRIAAGITPINHPPFTARFLLKAYLIAAPFAVCVGRTAVRHAAVRTIDREPLNRAMHALSVSKAPETAYTVTFAHRRPITLDDGYDLHAGHVLGSYQDRKTL